MNEEQAERLINILTEVRDELRAARYRTDVVDVDGQHNSTDMVYGAKDCDLDDYYEHYEDPLIYSFGSYNLKLGSEFPIYPPEEYDEDDRNYDHIDNFGYHRYGSINGTYGYS